MRRRFSMNTILATWLLLAICAVPTFATSEPSNPNRYWNAVQESTDYECQ